MRTTQYEHRFRGTHVARMGWVARRKLKGVKKGQRVLNTFEELLDTASE